MAAELPTAKRCNALSEFSQKLADSTAKELVYPELETCGEGDSGFEKWRPGTSAAVSSSQDVFSHAYAVLGTSFEQGLQCFGGLFHGVYCFCCAELRLFSVQDCLKLTARGAMTARSPLSTSRAGSPSLTEKQQQQKPLRRLGRAEITSRWSRLSRILHMERCKRRS